MRTPRRNHERPLRARSSARPERHVGRRARARARARARVRARARARLSRVAASSVPTGDRRRRAPARRSPPPPTGGARAGHGRGHRSVVLRHDERPRCVRASPRAIALVDAHEAKLAVRDLHAPSAGALERRRGATRPGHPCQTRRATPQRAPPQEAAIGESGLRKTRSVFPTQHGRSRTIAKAERFSAPLARQLGTMGGARGGPTLRQSPRG